MKRLFNFGAEKFPDPRLNKDCTEIEVNKWVISNFIVKGLVPVVGVHPYPLDELMLMTTAVTFFRPQYIFEWGTHIGKSARIFYEITKAFNITCSIHSVDLPSDVKHIENPGQTRGMMVKEIKEIFLHEGNGVTKAFEIINSISEEIQTLFFVDGDHSFESVKRELILILEKVHNPVVLLHDTFFQSAESNYNIGPFRAIKEAIKGEENCYEIISTHSGLPGMTLLFYKK